MTSEGVLLKFGGWFIKDYYNKRNWKKKKNENNDEKTDLSGKHKVCKVVKSDNAHVINKVNEINWNDWNDTNSTSPFIVFNIRLTPFSFSITLIKN